MYILGISAFYHDSAAALLCDGHIVAAAQEERFSRVKHDAKFPEQAVQFCLKYAGITLADIDHVVFYEKPFVKFERLLETYLSFSPRGLRSFWAAMPIWSTEKLFQKRNLQQALLKIAPDWQPKDDAILFSEHHLSHAASAFYPSGFDRAAILTVDGVGEWTTTAIGCGEGDKISLGRTLKFPHSLGLLYSAFTYYLGFEVNGGEYKVMGLAPYGRPVYAQKILEHLLDLRADGSFALDLHYFDYCTGLRMTNERFHRLFGGPPRCPETPLTERDMNLARSIQDVTEEAMLRLARQALSTYDTDRLCMAGGVALNAVANGRIRRETPVKQLWIQPAAGDAGGALGAALAAWHLHAGKPRSSHLPPAQDGMAAALLGPSYTQAEIDAFAAQTGSNYDTYDEDRLCDEVAALLAAGKVVGWFRGRMEFGPRALGARSILGDPRVADMQARINKTVKFRESFRPFAPAILVEHVGDYFEAAAESPYMLTVQPLCRSAHRPEVPAVTHVDGTSRLQTVKREDHPAFHRLLSAFYEQTGCPLLVNTSFNVRDEPIVNTPAEAYRCFVDTGLDALALENTLFVKQVG